MAKYHISSEGPKICKAHRGKCPYAIAGELHYDSMEDALEAQEVALTIEYGHLETLGTKQRVSGIGSTITLERPLTRPGSISRRNSSSAKINSFVKRHSKLLKESYEQNPSEWHASLTVLNQLVERNREFKANQLRELQELNAENVVAGADFYPIDETNNAPSVDSNINTVATTMGQEVRAGQLNIVTLGKYIKSGRTHVGGELKGMLLPIQDIETLQRVAEQRRIANLMKLSSQAAI